MARFLSSQIEEVLVILVGTICAHNTDTLLADVSRDAPTFEHNDFVSEHNDTILNYGRQSREISVGRFSSITRNFLLFGEF